MRSLCDGSHLAASLRMFSDSSHVHFVTNPLDSPPEKPLELVLPDELQDSLRLLKPEGNLLDDRFRTLIVQGKLESRKPVTQARKAKKKITEKWMSKDFKVPGF